jgi:hypothetical protein
MLDFERLMRIRQSLRATKFSLAWCFGALFGLAACVKMPEPPPESDDLSKTYAAYDHPTATLQESLVHKFLTEAQSLGVVVFDLSALSRLQTLISDMNSALRRDVGVAKDFEVQGAVRATVPCPGDDDATADAKPDPTAGELALEIGVRNTKIQHVMSGSANACRFMIPKTSINAGGEAVMNADLVVELGTDVAIGSSLPHALLVRASNLSGTLTSGNSTSDLPVEAEFRIVDDGSTEVLVDASQLGLGNLGTAIVVYHPDGSIGLRQKNGEWHCKSSSATCTLSH